MKKVLLVEDTVALAAEIADILLMENYDVTTTSSPTEGLSILNHLSPDLIITDLLMKEMDGFEFISELRKNDKFQKTPVIILSANATEDALKKGIEIGANLFIKKPCDGLHLIQSIEMLLKGNSNTE